MGILGTSVLWENAAQGGFCLGEVPKTRLLGMRSLEPPDVDRQSPFLHQESQECHILQQGNFSAGGGESELLGETVLPH